MNGAEQKATADKTKEKEKNCGSAKLASWRTTRGRQRRKIGEQTGGLWLPPAPPWRGGL